MLRYARSSTAMQSYLVAMRPIISNSCSVRHIHDGLLGLENMMPLMRPELRCSSSLASNFSPRYSTTSNASTLTPSTRHCAFCTGKHGSMKSTVSRCLRSWLNVSIVAKAPCIDPTVGTMHSSGMSMSTKALMNLLAALFRGSIPVISGYLAPTPLRSASHSASTPICSASSPGTPCSMRM